MKTKFLTGTRSAWFELVVILESNRGCSWDWRRNKLSFSEIKIYTNFFLLRNIFLCVYITISSHLTGALCPCARFVAFIGAVISTGVSSSNFNRSCCVRFSPNPLVKVRIRFFSPYLISGLSCLLVWIQNWLGVGQIHFGMEMAVATTTVVRFWLYANGSLHTNIILQGALTKYPTLFFPDKTNPKGGKILWVESNPTLLAHAWKFSRQTPAVTPRVLTCTVCLSVFRFHARCPNASSRDIAWRFPKRLVILKFKPLRRLGRSLAMIHWRQNSDQGVVQQLQT